MPLRLDARRRISRPSSRRSSPPSARPPRMSTARSPTIIADVARPRRRGGASTTPRASTGSTLDAGPACASADAEIAGRAANGARATARGARVRRRAHRGLPPPAAAARTSTITDDAGVGSARAGAPVDAVGALRAGRHRGLSVLGADERDPGQGRRASSGIVMVVPTPDGVLNPLVLAAAAARRRRRDLPHRRRAGGGGARLRHRDDRAGRQDRRPGQRLCRRRQAARLRPGRHRHDRRPVGDPGRRRPPQRSRLDRRRPAVAGRARRRGAVDPDHRRRRLRRRGRRRRRAPARSAAARATSPRASWRDNGAIIAGRATGTRRRRWSTASRPSISSWRSTDAEALAERVRHAGAIFLGRHTPEAIGDYVAGPNHVLPTARSARFSSGLGVLDFMKRTSLLALRRRERSRALGAGGDRAGRGRGPRRARALGRDPARAGR